MWWSRKIWWSLSIVFLTLTYLTHALADEKVAEPELTWAKRVATEFFEAGLSSEKPGELCTSPSVFLALELDAERKEKGLQNPVDKLLWQYEKGRFLIKQAELSPSRSEAILTCRLEPLPKTKPLSNPKVRTEEEELLTSFLGSKQDKPSDVAVWMAKDGEGRWRIRFIRAKAQN